MIYYFCNRFQFFRLHNWNLIWLISSLLISNLMSYFEIAYFRNEKIYNRNIFRSNKFILERYFTCLQFQRNLLKNTIRQIQKILRYYDDHSYPNLRNTKHTQTKNLKYLLKFLLVNIPLVYRYVWSNHVLRE